MSTIKYNNLSYLTIIGIGVVLFALGAVLLMFILRSSGLTMIFGIAPIFTAVPLVMCLLMTDRLLLSGKFRLKMILVSFVMIATQLFATMTLSTFLGTWFSSIFMYFGYAFFIFLNCIIGGFVFAIMLFGQKRRLIFVLICTVIAIPFGGLVNLLNTIAQERTIVGDYAFADLLWNMISPIGFFAMGFGITISLTFQKYRDAKL